MNRVIKFRGLSLNGEWYYGNLSIVPKKCDHIEAGSYISNAAGMPFAYQVRPETVGQYTSLSDKYDTAIYEGDVLKLVNNKGKEITVVCQFGSVERRLLNFVGDAHDCQITGFHFLVKNRYPTYPIVRNYLGVSDLEIMEIIGNIYS